MMRKLTNKLMLLVALGATVIVGCKKSSVEPDRGPKFTEFSLETSANPNLPAKVSAMIEGNEIYLRVPNALDITKIIPSFQVNEAAIAYIGNNVQESGVSVVDMSKTDIQYRLTTSSGTSSLYNLHALRNAAIISFGFYAEDNDNVLFKDYTATIEGLNIKVDLPSTADRSDLVARYTTSTGAVVRVNTQVQESKVTAVDYTNPVTFAVTDAETTTPQNFVVTIGSLSVQWFAVNTAALDKNIATLRLAIHPTTNEPYIIYGLASVTGGADSDRKAVVARLSGNSWSYVGPETGFSEGRVDLSTIAFDGNGKLYAAYKNVESGQTWHNKASVQKFENGAWSSVGTRGFTPHTVSYMDIAVGNDNIPTIGYTLAAAAGGAANRSTYTMRYTSDWVGISIPAITAAYYSRTFTGNDGHVYYVAMDMTSGTGSRRPTLYKSANGNWELVGTANVSPTTTTYGAMLVDATVAEDGTAYLVFQSQANAAKLSYVMKFNGTTWEQIGASIEHGDTSGSSGRDNIAVAIHPNGTLFLAYSDAIGGLKVTTYNTTTNNWNAATSLNSTNGDKIDLKISNDGIPYLATTIDSRVTIYKYDIPN